MRDFRQIDVFTDRFLRGNPVAVVHDADDISSEDMAAFARWTNLSETTFLTRPRDPQADYGLRIFTPERELPFAGHPTLGSARAWLAAGGCPRRGDHLIQECELGRIAVRRANDRLAFAAPPLLREGPIDRADRDRIVRALGLAPGAVVDARWADNGPGWIALLLRDAETVLAIEPDYRALAGYNVGVAGRCAPDAETHFEIRAFIASGAGKEDPVTGSLNAAIAQWLIACGRAPESYIASQGTKLARRGRIHIERRENAIWVGGDTIVGVTGTVSL